MYNAIYYINSIYFILCIIYDSVVTKHVAGPKVQIFKCPTKSQAVSAKVEPSWLPAGPQPTHPTVMSPLLQ